MKKRLTQIAKDFGIPFEEAQELVFSSLEEDMVSGKGKNTWITEAGQMALDAIVHIPVIYRGRVSRLCPNPMFVMVNIKEISQNVPARLPKLGLARQKHMLMKYVYVQMDSKPGEEPTYSIIKPPSRWN
jgi:hypothetical protein